MLHKIGLKKIFFDRNKPLLLNKIKKKSHEVDRGPTGGFKDKYIYQKPTNIFEEEKN